MYNRVAAIEFSHESNTFSVLPTTIENFHAAHYYCGDTMRDRLRGTNSEIGGFISAAEAHGWDARYIVAATATPGGTVVEAARREITDEVLERLRAEGPFDALFIALHGAMVTDTAQDGESQFLAEVRAVVGGDVPIAVTFDLHANIFDELADLAQIAVTYRTYPHVDMADRAVEACGLLHRALTGAIDPALVVARPPLIKGCDDGRTTNDGPMVRLLESAAQDVQQAGLLGISINAGFPEADVWALGSSVIVCYDRGSCAPDLAQRAAQKIMGEIWDWRETYAMPIGLADCMAAIDPAQAGAPLVIADYADNPGSGAYGDCTALLAALIARGVQNAALSAIWDPVAAADLAARAVGDVVTAAIGGNTDATVGGGPLSVTGEIMAQSDGFFTYEGPMFAGLAGNLGPSVRLRVGGIDVLIVSKRVQSLDLNIFRILGVEPVEKSLLAVKSMQHFRAAFAPIAREIIMVDAGGLSTPNVENRSYANVRRPVWPLDEVDLAK